MGVRDESTQKELLQVAKLTLSQSIDICRSYETTSKQLESMKAEEVLALDKETPTHPEHQKNESHVENVIRCKFCGKTHVRDKFQCPAWGKVCSVCNKRNHFAAMCASKPQQSPRKRLPGNRKMVSCVDHDTDSSEEFIAMLTIKEDISEIHTDEDKAKPYASMNINDRLETFLLDSGATVNVMSKKTLDQLFRKPGRKRIEKTNTTLVMYNRTEIKPVGKIRLRVIHQKNLKKYSEFLVVEENCKLILGVRASQQMKLLQVNKESIFASKTVPATRPV